MNMKKIALEAQLDQTSARLREATNELVKTAPSREVAETVIIDTLARATDVSLAVVETIWHAAKYFHQGNEVKFDAG